MSREEAGNSGGTMEPDLVPIVLGVVGHRDLPPEEMHRSRGEIRLVIQQLRALYPATPVVVLSSLAEGADVAGARAALDEGVGLIAPLPMDPDAYKRTFSDPEHEAVFDELLARCDDVVVCRHLGEGEDSQERQFARAGAAVVRYSHLLLALWNGEDEGKPAGTARTVEYAIKGVPNQLLQDLEGGTSTPLDPPAEATVRQILVRRQSRNCEPAARTFPNREEGSFAALEIRKGKADLKLSRSLERIFQRFQDFNRTVLARRPGGNTDWVDLATYRSGSGDVWRPLVPDSVARSLPPGLLMLRQHFSMADSLAGHFQQISVGRLLNFVLGAGFLVAILHEFFITMMTDDPDSRFRGLLGWVYLGLLGLTWVVSQLARWLRWQDKFQDIRTLAEGLRVQFYWHLAGIRTPVVNFHLRKQKDELDWIRSVLRLWYLRSLLGGGLLTQGSPELAKTIRDEWLVGQRDYFKRKARQNGILDRRWALTVRWIGFILLALSLVAIVLKDLIWVALMALFGSLALLFNNYREVKATAEHHKSYSRMAVLFERAADVFDPEGGIDDEGRAVLEELGREALTETGDWLLLHRKRPIRV